MTQRVVTFVHGMPPIGRCVVAIGVFDGVHLGHCDLLNATAEEARERHEIGMAVTFDRDPDQIVTPEAAAPQLLTLAEKLAAISACGIDVVLVVPFTPQVAEFTPQEFLDEVLGTVARVSSIHVGRDFRFGHRAAGDVAALKSWAASRSAVVHPHDLFELDGAPVTSTRIRKLVSAGDIDSATALLGRPPRVNGTVVRGRGEGASLGFPTANVKPLQFSAVPGDGVYACSVVLDDGTRWPAAVSVGIPPMFPESKDFLEAHLIDFEGDLYGEHVTVEFLRRLRDQRRYDSLDDLKAAIARDVALAAECIPTRP